MKVSIITVSYNSEGTIKDTIESILKQTYENIEYIIIDGNSKDSTTSIIKSYEGKFKGRLIWKSEPDNGLYDAMNKGIRLASGEIVAILNSDDFYNDQFVIEKVVDKMKDYDCLYSDLQFVDQFQTEKVIRTWKAGTGSFPLGWNPPHPTTFFKKAMYERFGYFNNDYKIAADYDLLYRFMNKKGISVFYLEDYLVRMRIGGKSTSGIQSTIKANKEVWRSLKGNQAVFPFGIVFMRLFRKVKQVF